MKRNRSWTLSNTVIDGRHEDRFDLHAVAQELAEVVQSATASMAVGLLAPFGTGKSSVIRMLDEELAVNKRYAVLRVSAENHSGIARARALLYALLDDAHNRGLIKDDDHVNHRACLEGARQRAVSRKTPDDHYPDNPSAMRYIRAVTAATLWAGAAVLAVWFFGVAAVLLAHVLGHGQGISTWSWFAARGASAFTGLLLATPIVALILTTVRDAAINAVKRPEITINSPRPDTTDELEQAFTRLLKSVSRRVVIAIDDIDRLPATDVLDALTVVRSLVLAADRHDLKPVFVLACDEDVVREAITGVRPGLAHRSWSRAGGSEDAARMIAQVKQDAAREFLNKLFTVRIPMPAPQEADLRDFAMHHLTEPEAHPIVEKLGGTGPTQDVVDILIHKGVRTPRDAVRLLNDFLTIYRLASRREAPQTGRVSSITSGGVTGYPFTLARIVVLRADFRELYDKVAAEQELLAILDEALLGDKDAFDDPMLDALRDEKGSRLDTARWPGLDFLRATAQHDRRRRPLEVGPLFTLTSAPASRQLGSSTAKAIQQALLGRDADALLERFGDLRSMERLLTAVDRTLENAREGQDLDNAVWTAVKVLGQVPELALRVSASGSEGRAILAVTDRIMRRRPELTVSLNAEELADLLPIVRDSNVAGVIAALSVLPTEKKDKLAWVSVLLPLACSSSAPDQIVSAVEGYFLSLSNGGDNQDLAFWLDATKAHSLFSARAFGSLLAMAGRSGDSGLMARAAEVVVAGAARHEWHADVVYGLMLLNPTLDLDMSYEVLQLLQVIPVPADGWSDVTPELRGITDPSPAARLVLRMTEFLGDDDEQESSGETAEFLRSWALSVGGLASTVEGESIVDVVASAIADKAGFGHQVSIVAAALAPDLDEKQAGAFVSKIAAELEQHYDEADQIGQVLFTIVLEYVRTAPLSMDKTANACLDRLLAPLAESGENGRFVRRRLPAVLDTQRGDAARSRIFAQLLAPLPNLIPGTAPGDGLNGEIITAVHVLFTDAATRTAYLPQLLTRIQQSIPQGHPQAAVEFAARYANEQAVDNTWMPSIAQFWSFVSATARDRVLSAVARPEAQIPSLLPLLLDHLLNGGEDENWEHATDLYAVVDDAGKARIMASADGRCPDLAVHARRASADLLLLAMIQSEDLVSEVVKLAEGNPALSVAVNDYVAHWLGQTEWHADWVLDAVSGSSAPMEVWDLALAEAKRSLSSADRAADILKSVVHAHPGVVPTDLSARIAPVLRAADESAAGRIGAALSTLPRQVLRKIDGELKDRGVPLQQQPGRRAFRAASGIGGSGRSKTAV